MRSTIRKLVERLDGALALPEPIYEFGAFQPSGQESRAVRELFANRDYVGADMREGPGVDRVLDLEALDLPDDSIGTAISLDTFEHVQRFWKASSELHRVLRPGGYLLLCSVMYFPVHDYPSDYWRFTPEGFRALVEPFESVFVESAGLRDFPHTVVAVAVKGPVGDETAHRIRRELALWKRRDAQGWKEILTLILPPILMSPLYRWYAGTRPGSTKSP